jgi:iron complex transport system substrate-binding protein
MVALGSGIAETVCELGACGSLIAVDQSARGLASVAGLPQVGYFRALSLEPLLALEPTLVLASALAGPPAVLAGLESAGVRVVTVPEEATIEGLGTKLRAIGAAIGLAEAAAIEATRIERELSALGAALAAIASRPRAVYLFGIGGGGLQAAGRATLADGLMRLAGLENGFADAEGYHALSAEVLLMMQPDFILVGEQTLAAHGGVEGLERLPALAGVLGQGGRTRLIRHDDARLLGLGPHTADEVLRIALAAHPALAKRFPGAGCGDEPR